MSRQGRRKVRGATSAASTEDLPLALPVRPELGIADLLGAASAWATSHPREGTVALVAIFDAARIPQRDPRFEACKAAVKSAMGRGYAGPTVVRLAALFEAEGPRAISSAFWRASATAQYRQDLAEVAAAK